MLLSCSLIQKMALATPPPLSLNLAPMKPLIYVETSVISYLTARTSRDMLTAARQTWTREWWDVADQHWDLKASELVVE